MAKTITIESPVKNFSGVRNTDFGQVKFFKGIAKVTSKRQAEYLVNRGYFCKELGALRPEPEAAPEENDALKDKGKQS